MLRQSFRPSVVEAHFQCVPAQAQECSKTNKIYEKRPLVSNSQNGTKNPLTSDNYMVLYPVNNYAQIVKSFRMRRSEIGTANPQKSRLQPL